MGKGYSGLSGSKGGSRGAISAKQIDAVMNPTTKAEFVQKLNVLAEVGQGGYETVAVVKDWENYGKSRTYLQVSAYRESDGKFHHSFDFGYIDNKTGEYVNTKGRALLNLKETEFSLSGSKLKNEDIVDALKKLKK